VGRDAEVQRDVHLVGPDGRRPIEVGQHGVGEGRSLTETAWNPNRSAACATVAMASAPTYGPKCARLTPIRGMSMAGLQSSWLRGSYQ
jgi:hypothetical protein